MKPIKILVAEDEESIREFIVLNLKRAGYDVIGVFMKNWEESLSSCQVASTKWL